MEKSIEINFAGNGKKPKIAVEAGHIYTNESPGEEHKTGAALGGFLSNYFESLGAEVEKWLFIDDYNPQFQNKPSNLDINKYCDLLSGQKFGPDVLFYESNLTKEADKILKYLQDKNYSSKDLEGNVFLNKGGIMLYDSSIGKYKCPLLDACLYKEKFGDSDSCVTVLDENYSSQQKKTSKILKKLGMDTKNIFPVYFSSFNSNNDKDLNKEFNSSYFVGSALNLLKNISGLSGSIKLDSNLEMEVQKYGI